jgi:hypothetical protein
MTPYSTVDRNERMSRRAFLGSTGAVAVALAGCSTAQLDRDSQTPTQTQPPAAAFEFTFAPAKTSGKETGILTIIHMSGEPLPSDQLHVRGDGFTSVNGPYSPDRTTPGVWTGTTTDRDGGAPVVSRHDTLEIGTKKEYSIKLIWETDKQSAVVGEGSAQSKSPAVSTTHVSTHKG